MLDLLKEKFSFLKKIQKPKKLIKDHDKALLQRVHGKKFPSPRQIFHFKIILSPSERRIFNISILAFIVSIIWFVFVITDNYRVQVPTVGGKYTEAIVGSPQLVNPLFASTNDVDRDLVKLIYSGLMRYDNQQRLVPDLAAKPPEISEDKKVYTFELRQDVVWHKAKEEPEYEKFTAQDVVFTIHTIQDEQTNSPLYFTFQGVEVEALDDYTVQFRLKESFAPFLSALTVGILPEHVWFDVAPERMRLTQKNLQPIGTGPFQFSKFTKDETGYILTFELNRFDRFYRQTPYLEEFVFHFFPDYEGVNGPIQALREGQIDGINFVPKDLKDKVARKHINLYTLQLPEYTALFFNDDHEPFLQSLDVRKALAYAVDKDRILRESLNNEGEVIYSPILSGFPGYNPEIEKTPYSVEKANQLLDKNWTRVSSEDYRKEKLDTMIIEWKAANPAEVSTSTDETAGEGTEAEEIEVPEEVLQTFEQTLDIELNAAQTFYRRNDDDEILEIEIVTSESVEHKHTAELLAGFWQEIGVKSKLKFVPTKDISREVLKTRNYDILLYGMIIGSDPDQYPFWHSSQVDFPGLNLARYVNRSVDDLLVKARETTDETQEIELYKKFQDTILEDMPAIFLYIPTYTYATSDKIKGINISRISHPSDRFTQVTNWYIDTKGEWKRN